jgi:hypothetical protein
MVGLDDALRFSKMMFTKKFKQGFASNLYKTLMFILVHFKTIILILIFLTRHVLRRNSTLNPKSTMGPIDNTFFLMIGA